MPPSTKVLTVNELAEYLRVHRSTIYRLLKKGQLPGFKIGSDWRFNVEVIDEWRLRQGPGGPGEEVGGWRGAFKNRGSKFRISKTTENSLPYPAPECSLVVSGIFSDLREPSKTGRSWCL